MQVALYIIVDLPDNMITTAITAARDISGTFSINTVVLHTPEQLDEAMGMRKTIFGVKVDIVWQSPCVTYRPADFTERREIER